MHAVGVVHEFVSVIDLDPSGLQAEAQAEILTIVSGAERAALLTDRLLSFGQRQVLDPQSVDVGRLIADLKDPIERMRSFLWKNQLADQDFFDALEDESEALAVRLREGCRALPDPAPLSMFDHVYAEPHPLVAEERAGGLVPRVRGRAFVTGRTTLFFDPLDPFREGFTAAR